MAAIGAVGAGGGSPRVRLVEYATLGLLTLIWGTTWAAIRIGLRGIPPFTGVALRFAIGAAALLAAARAAGVPLWRANPDAATPAPRPSSAPAGAAGLPRSPAPAVAGRPRSSAPAPAAGSPWRVWLANAALTFCIPYGVLYWGEQWVPSGLAAVLFATSPLWVALAAHVALPGERLRGATLAGVLIGFAGVAVIFSEDLRALGGPRVAGAAALLLVAPLPSAFGVVAVKRWSAGLPGAGRLGAQLHPLLLAAAPAAGDHHVADQLPDPDRRPADRRGGDGGDLDPADAGRLGLRRGRRRGGDAGPARHHGVAGVMGRSRSPALT